MGDRTTISLKHSDGRTVKTLHYLDTLKNKWGITPKGYAEIFLVLVEKFRKQKRTIKKLKGRVINLEAQLNQPPPKVKPLEEPSTVKEAPQDTRSISATPTLPVEHPQCPFYTDGSEGLVDCSKDYDTRGVIHKITQEICNQCWTRQEQRRAKALEETNLEQETSCLCRYEHNGEHYCFFGRKPRKLEHGLKMCLSCKDRLTLEEAEAKDYILRTKKYVTCGATETTDTIKGPMLYSRNSQCPHQNRWITIDMCEQANCPMLKKVKVKFSG